MTSLRRTAAAAAVAIAILFYLAASVSAKDVDKTGRSTRRSAKCDDLFNRCGDLRGVHACRQCQNVCDGHDAYFCAVAEPIIVCEELVEQCEYDIGLCYPCATTCERASKEVPDRTYASPLAAHARECRRRANKH